MTVSEVSHRYAQALFEIAKDQQQVESVLEQIREIKEILFRNPEILTYLQSPLFKSDQKVMVLAESIKGKGLLAEVESFLLLLTKKNRISLFSEILHAFQELTDEANQVTRGTVWSALPLAQEDRKAIEEKVSSYTQKNVILAYKEDPSILGGLVAKIGSFTFDDTLVTHLKRLKEELKRRAH